MWWWVPWSVVMMSQWVREWVSGWVICAIYLFSIGNDEMIFFRHSFQANKKIKNRIRTVPTVPTISLSLSLSHSLTLTALTHSLTHSLTHPLTHSLTISPWSTPIRADQPRGSSTCMYLLGTVIWVMMCCAAVSAITLPSELPVHVPVW